MAKEVATDDDTDALILGEIEHTPLEFRRNLAFILYGGLYQGMAQEIIFNDVFPIIFGDGVRHRYAVLIVLNSVLH